jgi:NAD(H)-dependent 7beta-hydroxy-3-oxo-delta4-cholenoic acid oxidoreductase
MLIVYCLAMTVARNENRLQQLFSPIRIGGLEIRNRIAMAPMATDFGEGDGRVSQKLIDYHAARARGGVGLIIMEVTGVDAQFPYMPRSVGLWADDLIPGYRRLTEAIHSYGAKIIPQVSHPGPDSLSSLLTGIEAVGPTAGILNDITKTACRGLAADEILRIVEQYAETARRARDAGCDGIELHAAHGYMLMGSFLSALRNRRTDGYGGSMERGMRFPLEVIRAIRQKVGRDFPIVLRISGDEMVPGGRTIKETQEIAPQFVEAGIDAFHVSSGAYPDLSWRVIPPTGTPLALNAHLSAALKQVVDVPVMVVGRINDPRLAEDILRRGDADMVVMGRALLADPDLPAKAAEGRFDDIAPCIGCGLGCVTAREQGGDTTCLVNPTVGREAETRLQRANRPKKVLVAGGGPAGLMAAITAARRGHSVELFERTARLGGLYNLASVAPGKQELTRVVQYLEIQASKAGVSVHLDAEVTPASLKQSAPEVLIVATGSEPCTHSLPGAEGPNVLCARDIVAGQAAPPTGRVLVAGGGTVGCEVAELIATAGREARCAGSEPTSVLVVELREAVAMDMFSEARTLLLQRLEALGVRLLASTRLVSLAPDGALVSREGPAGPVEERLSGFDWIVTALGAKALDELSAGAAAAGIEVHVVGDAREPRQAVAAIAEGFEAGRLV